MVRQGIIIGVMVTIAGAGVAAVATLTASQDKKPGSSSGWQLPPDADEKKSPLTVDDKIIATGKSVFKDKCSRCHGPGGLGDGEDSDPDAREDMDLTNPKRIEQNSDGVVFYKVWNGRRKPKMPAFKEELSEQQAWAVVAYVQTLRKAQ
jgi:mono/diheme cytochrome c family protein